MGNIASSLKKTINPFGKSNPLRPDNFTKNSLKLMKNPFSKTAQHASYGDTAYRDRIDAEHQAQADAERSDRINALRQRVYGNFASRI